MSRFAESFAILAALLAGERVTAAGRWWSADDAVLLPAPARRRADHARQQRPADAVDRRCATPTPGTPGGRTTATRPEGFARRNEAVTRAARDAGRDPATILRSACVLVALDRDAGERPITAAAPPLEGTPAQIAAGLRDLAAAGADEAILVRQRRSPRRSIRALGPMLAILDE